MIRLPYPPLSPPTAQKLAQYQQEIDSQTDFEQKVATAKKAFGGYNKKGNAAFDEVKQHLNSMSCGAERCHYCEDSKADEVEHIKPKDWYPDVCFVWDNYCYACGSCNGPKNNKFAIFKADDNSFYELKKDKKSKIAIMPPPAGTSVMINPRFENPLNYLFLDIQSSFNFVAYHNNGTTEHTRAEYTIKILGLNTRAYLAKARRNAYSNYKARLFEYIRLRNDPTTPPQQLKNIVQNLQEELHQTVWQEMKRQQNRIQELKVLFDSAPEALSW